MPYVERESLSDRLGREGSFRKEALPIAHETGQALQYAHEHGVIHRDIKPANLLLTQDGNTLVTDFGMLSKDFRQPRAQSRALHREATVRGGASEHEVAHQKQLLPGRCSPQSQPLCELDLTDCWVAVA